MLTIILLFIAALLLAFVSWFMIHCGLGIGWVSLAATLAPFILQIHESIRGMMSMTERNRGIWEDISGAARRYLKLVKA